VALFGEKCARCGKKRTKEEYQGLPTCESCRVLLEKKLEASKEESHSCPVDGQRLEKEIVMSVIVDRCPACRGVWLDGGELEQLRGAIAAGVTSDLVRGLSGPF
jgi:ribosomal protein L37AE/L43A